MSELTSDFQITFPNGPKIEGCFRIPCDRFHVMILFGPSGSGKTTLLRCLAGLERPTKGFIQFEKTPWFDAEKRIFMSPANRGIGMMFQDYALFPHLTVGENIGYGLRRSPASERKQRVAELIEKFQLGSIESRFAYQISGGQQQRVALARAIARKPKLLLLDEPLSALDAVLREDVRGELRRMLADIKIPCCIVTHDRNEAMALGDQIAILDEGRILQSGGIVDVFSRPIDRQVAQIVGIETIVAGEILTHREGLARVRVADVELSAITDLKWNRKVFVCVQADEVLLMRSKHEGMSVRNQFPATIESLSPEGPLVRVTLDCGFRLVALITRSACSELALRESEQIVVAIKAQSILLIPR